MDIGPEVITFSEADIRMGGHNPEDPEQPLLRERYPASEGPNIARVLRAKLECMEGDIEDARAVITRDGSYEPPKGEGWTARVLGARTLLLRARTLQGMVRRLDASSPQNTQE